jgi:hypothetical protein
MNIPLEHGDEVVSATRFAREGATSTPEQIIVVTRYGAVFSLTWMPSGRQRWICKPVDLLGE